VSGSRSEGHKAAQEASKRLEGSAEDEEIPERRRFRSPGFQRLPTDWDGPETVTLQRVRAAVERRLLVDFADAYRVLNEVWDVVRTPRLDAAGEKVRDVNGLVVWERDDYGRFIEDWSRLTQRNAENLMFSITTNLFTWEQTAADAWSEAMYARSLWEESFSSAFDGAPPSRVTVDDKSNYAQRSAIEERYFAVFLSGYSKRADALVRSIERLSYRLERWLRT